MKYWRPGLLVLAFLNLITGMLSGLGRLGWQIPMPEAYAHHGAIMVGGFLGTLIALEKVIPLKRPFFFLGPLMSALSIAVFLRGDFHIAVAMQIGAGILFLGVYITYLRSQYSNELVMALIGVLCWVIGTSLLFWKQFYPMAFPWYIGFLLFTIVAERLELSRFLPVTQRQRHVLFGFLGLFLLSLILPFHKAGNFLAGGALILVGSWLLRFDVIRITLRKEALARFTAIALLCGYIALIVEGFMLALVSPEQPFGYDMMVHTFFLGFAFLMIFAHGPIILPGVLGLSVKPYHPSFYFPVALLIFSLVLRLAADSFLIPIDYRAYSGWITMGAILLYFVMMATATLRAFIHSQR